MDSTDDEQKLTNVVDLQEGAASRAEAIFGILDFNGKTIINFKWAS